MSLGFPNSSCIIISVYMAAQKITTREELAPKVKDWRDAGKKVGFTSGAFDILHAGHVRYLEEAKRRCDVLIVGVNTDESVKEYKGEDRPIVPEAARVAVVAALESVDYVFTFSERRNRVNIETLKPSYYIKAGDYTKEQLTSSDVVEKYGGEVLLIPPEEGFSTSNIITKISQVFGGQVQKIDKREMQKAVLIDRDGVINEEVEYLHEPEKFRLMPHAGEGMKKIQDLGYKIIILTIQAGIGIGYFKKEDFFKVNKEMFKQLKPYGVIIDKIYFATHSKTVDGKNPKTELIERAQHEIDLDLKKSVVIGDKTGDLAAGEPFGCLTIAMQTGHALQDGQYDVTPNYSARDLLDAALWLEKQ